MAHIRKDATCERAIAREPLHVRVRQTLERLAVLDSLLLMKNVVACISGSLWTHFPDNPDSNKPWRSKRQQCAKRYMRTQSHIAQPLRAHHFDEVLENVARSKAQVDPRTCS